MSTAELAATALDASDSAALTRRLTAALQATIFASRLTINPRRVGQLAESCAGSFRRYLAGDEGQAAVTAFGQQLAQSGLGHGSLLALLDALCSFLGEHEQLLEAARTAHRYCLPLLAGYMAAREAYLLAEQERTRVALGRAQLASGADPR